MNKIFLIIVVLFSFYGCSAFTVQNPKIDNLIGEWEATAPMIYAKLIVHSEDNNILITINENKAINKFTLKEFKSLENGFEVQVVDLSSNNKPEKMKGALMLGKLILEPVDNKDMEIWFIRSKDLSKYQEIVNGEIEKYNQQLNFDAAKNAAQVN